MTSTAANKPISYAGYRFPPEVISYAVWLYFRFPLSLRMVEEMLAARGIEATYETVRRWALKFGAAVARRSRANAPACGDKWHLDEVVVTINGHKHWHCARSTSMAPRWTCWCRAGVTDTPPGG